MFISKTRDIVIPQSEHQRLAGVLAFHWGNAAFELPGVDRASFVLGVATHDRAFGELDTAAIGKISDQEREAQVDRWISSSFDDPVAELVVLLHVKRLMAHTSQEAHAQKINHRVAQIVAARAIDLAPFLAADTITAFCDLVAFDFCFETPVKRTTEIFAAPHQSKNVRYRLDGARIKIDPWVFDRPRIEGYIQGYRRDGYPKDLQPVILPYEITAG